MLKACTGRMKEKKKPLRKNVLCLYWYKTSSFDSKYVPKFTGVWNMPGIKNYKIKIMKKKKNKNFNVLHRIINKIFIYKTANTLWNSESLLLHNKSSWYSFTPVHPDRSVQHKPSWHDLMLFCVCTHTHTKSWILGVICWNI